MAIKIKPSHKGLLHKKLGVAQGKPLSEKSIKKAEHSSSAKERKEAVFAENARHWSHKGKTLDKHVSKAVSKHFKAKGAK